MILTEWNTEEAIEVAKEEGIEVGFSQGQLQKAREMAKVLLSKGIEPSIIAESSGLSEEEIARLL